MSHLSPSVFLLWAVLTTALGIFYFHHLWKFDRFRCLNITRTNDGAFKRFMTFSYLIAVPVLLTYTVGFTVIKFREGFILLPSGAISPKPFQQWSPQHQAALFPLNLFWAISWAAEAVSHLEELCFWHFLVQAGPAPTPWFRSIYFRLWAGGSTFSVISLITVTVVTRHDPLKNEAYLQLVGSTFSLLITIGFLPILWIFKRFVQSVKNDGGDIEAVVRLAKFHDLNIVRTFFRFLFVIPVLILSIDGITPHDHTINESVMWTELLAMSSGVGCIVQSVITLMIFFPRNVQMETQRWLHTSAPRSRKAVSRKVSKPETHSSQTQQVDDRPKYLLTDSPILKLQDLSTVEYSEHYYPQDRLHYNDPQAPQPHPYLPWDETYSMQQTDQQHDLPKLQSVSGSSTALTAANLRIWSESVPRVNPLALYFTSPIDLLEKPLPALSSRRSFV